MSSEREVVRRRRYTSAQQRGQWIERYQSSGLTQRQFVRRHGLALSTFQLWLRQARAGSDELGNAQAPTPLLREVSLSSVLNAASPWVAEVARGDGWIVRVSAGVTPELLDHLLRAH